MSHSLLNGYSKAAVAQLTMDCLGGNVLKVMDSEYYRQFKQIDLSVFCLMAGLYCLPTTELINKLNELIMEKSPARNAIEIGSGRGTIADALGIIPTDSWQQDRPEMKAHYASMGQPTVSYGSHVLKMDGNSAVDHFKPDVVCAAWVTHLWVAEDQERGGNMYGIDEQKIINSVKRYVVVGNRAVHGAKPIMPKVSDVIEGDFLFSRSANNSSENAIFVWDRA